MSLNQETIVNNKKVYCDLVRSIQREGADIEGLIKYLEESDFFIAPASTIYHNNVDGGLCDHSLNVYYQFVQIVMTQYPNMVKEVEQEDGTKRSILDFTETPITHETALIATLFHDLSKANYYDKTFRNKKVYSEDGKQKDANGRYEWVSQQAFAVKPAKDRFLFGTHEETSEFILRQFIPLSHEESIAILHHTGPVSGRDGYNFTPIYTNCKLAAWLHAADFLAAMTLETTYE